MVPEDEVGDKNLYLRLTYCYRGPALLLGPEEIRHADHARVEANQCVRYGETAGQGRGALRADCCYTFRATGITAYLEAGGTIEKAQQIAAHESPEDHQALRPHQRPDTLDEIERIAI